MEYQTELWGQQIINGGLILAKINSYYAVIGKNQTIFAIFYRFLHITQ